MKKLYQLDKPKREVIKPFRSTASIPREAYLHARKMADRYFGGHFNSYIRFLAERNKQEQDKHNEHTNNGDSKTKHQARAVSARAG